MNKQNGDTGTKGHGDEGAGDRPRSLEDYREALEACKKQLVHNPLQNPGLSIHLPVAIEALGFVVGVMEATAEIEARREDEG